jgi:hypothetical protein
MLNKRASTLDLDANEPELEPWERRGFLKKRKSLGWGTYYFFLSSDRLEYWNSREEYVFKPKQTLVGTVSLNGVEAELHKTKENHFKVKKGEHSWTLYHNDQKEVNDWVKQIRCEIQS